MIEIEKLIPGGQALATLKDGKKAFFWNALPGETVESYDITKKKSRYIEAVATKISNPSRHRINPKDACFLSTSPWQIMKYDYELEQKSELVIEVFREHHIDIDKPNILTDNKEYHYRNKMEYALYWNNDKNIIELAFHARGSHRKTPITKSSIERPEIFQTAKEIINILNVNHEEARTYQSLLLRCNQKGEVSGGLYENGKPHPKFNNLKDQILGQEYSYSPNGFFQINLPVYEMALKEIKSHINTDKVLDLYSGVGTIGLSVAKDKQLTLVECDGFAFAEMAKNINNGFFESRNGVARGLPEVTTEDEGASPVTTGASDPSRENTILDSNMVRNGNIYAILDKSENVTNYITPDQTVILDPPRAGCDKKLIAKLNEIKPQTIIYLSCNPATQARDTKLLLENYQIKTVKTFNFFPRTPHIENLVVLSL
ncbi:class I SAM-dependent RNA methyltransferase [Candidatus Saccharibacteria bacterium]|nr:class I SAM-dependent RNA methyltransferase [Candidatus Saccharibacteria bacterium]